MAGAGYKLFNTGDVLTAAQVNTYLMEQTVMVFDDATARTTALTGVVSEGMISYLKDTNAVEVYNGSAWVASDDPNAIQNTIVDAKGDLIAASAADTPARLAVGNNGETLLADSSTSTGLRWGNNLGFTAGKNKIINGDFNIWQRGTSFSNPNVNDYFADRWKLFYYNAKPTSATISRQAFTAGAAPVAGYESQYFFRSTITTVGTTTNYQISQLIEDVRTLAGQTVTVSFWAKADSARSVSVNATQYPLGSGGGAISSSFNLTTSWVRYSFTGTLASLSGATINANSYLTMTFDQACASGSVLDIWGVQVEAGSVATAFQTATGTLAGELALAQRYYIRTNTGYGYGNAPVFVMGGSGNGYYATFFPPVQMRTNPTSVDFSNIALWDGLSVIAISTATIAAGQSNPNCIVFSGSATSTTQFRPYGILNNANSAGYLGFSAEL